MGMGDGLADAVDFEETAWSRQHTPSIHQRLGLVGPFPTSVGLGRTAPARSLG
jgi:hypothetical protein